MYKASRWSRKYRCGRNRKPRQKKWYCGNRTAPRYAGLVAELPEPFREVIVLREMNDLSYKEIAEVAGVPVGTVMSRLARARSMLRSTYVAESATARPGTAAARGVAL